MVWLDCVFGGEIGESAVMRWCVAGLVVVPAIGLGTGGTSRRFAEELVLVPAGRHGVSPRLGLGTGETSRRFAKGVGPTWRTCLAVSV